ncbi:MAG: DUF2884 family protein [Rhodanobacteraceae bacterium]|nr:MAG: DUF2884 family protein [Rhodanobacteraceae bacterium]
MHKYTSLLTACGFLALTACSAGQPSSSSTTAASASSSNSPLARMIDHELDKANVELTTQDITLSSNDSEPKAEITPQGDLLIAGKPVSLTPAQRDEVLAYRSQVIKIGHAGIAIGKQGATLGLNAASQAIAGAFSGQSGQQIRQRVEAQASGIRQAAAKICDRLPAMMASQQKLAAEVPAFKPYADLTPAKIAECRNHALHDDDNDDD